MCYSQGIRNTVRETKREEECIWEVCVCVCARASKEVYGWHILGIAQLTTSSERHTNSTEGQDWLWHPAAQPCAIKSLHMLFSWVEKKKSQRESEWVREIQTQLSERLCMRGPLRSIWGGGPSHRWWTGGPRWPICAFCRCFQWLYY